VVSYDGGFMGLPLTVTSDDDRVTPLVVAGLAPWGAVPFAAGQPGLTVHVRVSAAAHAPLSELRQPRVRARGAHVRIALGPLLVEADLRRSHAAATMPGAALADARWFRWHVLSVTRLLASARARAPIHAVALVRRGRAVLLAAPSGGGKTSLAYAGLARGYQVLADDVVHVEPDSGRLWGFAEELALEPEAAGFFPELARLESGVRPNGEDARFVTFTPADARRALTFCGPLTVVALDGAPSAPGPARPMAAHELERAVLGEREPGFDLFESLRRRAAHRLRAERGVWLPAQPSPQALLDRIDRLLDVDGDS
jgi:hypothetical protein